MITVYSSEIQLQIGYQLNITAKKTINYQVSVFSQCSANSTVDFAAVTLERPSTNTRFRTLTSNAGLVTFSDIQEGTYQLTVLKNRYSTSSSVVNIRNSESVVKEISKPGKY